VATGRTAMLAALIDGGIRVRVKTTESKRHFTRSENGLPF